MTNPLPTHLHAAYDWTASAGEIDQLRWLPQAKAEQYAAESAANARANDYDDVTADDLLALRDYLIREDGGRVPDGTEPHAVAALAEYLEYGPATK